MFLQPFCGALTLIGFEKKDDVATTNATAYSLTASAPSTTSRDLTEVCLGFVAIMTILWLPTRQQLIFGPIALLIPLALVLLRPPGAYQLGLSWRGLVSSLWILPAAIALAFLGTVMARLAGTYHPLYHGDLRHVGGYVIWTVYQQFLLQDYFMPRLTRLLTSNAAVGIAATLFAVAHLPNLPLTVATLAWGVASCALFRRYRSLYIFGVAQGLLGLCFAVCIPDAMHHHMRVGLGFYHYHAVPDPAAHPGLQRSGISD
jgi:Type II CAAX prenyl endopeptidase Rce1-like